MYAQLGDIVFEALIGPSSMDINSSQNYAQHDIILSKPRLQRIGSGLDSISMLIKFHARFCNPQEQIDLLKTALDDAEILPLINGNGRFLGDYVIASMAQSVLKTGTDGQLWDVDVTLELLEFFDPSLDKDTPVGFANTASNPTEDNPIQFQSSASELSSNVNALFNQAAQSEQQLDAADVDSSQTDARLSNVQASTVKMDEATNSLETTANKADIIDQTVALRAYLGDVRTAISNLRAIAALGSITDTRVALANLQLVFDNVRTLSGNTVVLYATRR